MGAVEPRTKDWMPPAGEWSVLPTWVVESGALAALTPRAAKVYIALLSLTPWSRTNEVSAAQSKVARLAGLQFHAQRRYSRTCGAAIQELVQRGLIEVVPVKAGLTCRYRVLIRPDRYMQGGPVQPSSPPAQTSGGLDRDPRSNERGTPAQTSGGRPLKRAGGARSNERGTPAQMSGGAPPPEAEKTQIAEAAEAAAAAAVARGLRELGIEPPMDERLPREFPGLCLEAVQLALRGLGPKAPAGVKVSLLRARAAEAIAEVRRRGEQIEIERRRWQFIRAKASEIGAAGWSQAWEAGLRLARAELGLGANEWPLFFHQRHLGGDPGDVSGDPRDYPLRSILQHIEPLALLAIVRAQGGGANPVRTYQDTHAWAAASLAALAVA